MLRAVVLTLLLITIDGHNFKKTKRSVISRIINGDKASKSQFLFYAQIHYKLKEDLYILNGGSIISEWYILTSAHCIVRYKLESSHYYKFNYS